MTGISKSASHPSSAENLLTENCFQTGSMNRFRKEFVGRTASDDSAVRPQTEKLPRTSKFGRLLQRSMSLIHTSSVPKRVVERVTITPESSNSSSPQDIEVNLSTPSSDDSDSDDNGITNAFIFSASPQDLRNTSGADNVGCRNKNVTKKTTIRAVKVTRVHSQKTPHIRYAARKLTLGDYKDLQWDSKRTEKADDNDSDVYESVSTEYNDSTCMEPGSSLDDRLFTVKDDKNEKETNSDDMDSDFEFEETIELAETLPFTVDCLEDLEVQAINANAPDVSVIAAKSETSSSIIQTSTQELAEYLKQSVNDLHCLEELDSLRSDKFNLINENLSSLDDQLTEEFASLDSEDGWTILGPFTAVEQRETLMHFGGRFGLTKFCEHLLTLPGGKESLDIANQSGLLPSDVASNECYDELALLLIRSKQDSSRDESVDSPNTESPQAARHQLLSAAEESTMDYSDMGDAATARCSTSDSLRLDANIDMLHQLIEEIEIDRNKVSDTTSFTDSADPSFPRRAHTNADPTLGSIPETIASDSDASDDEDGPSRDEDGALRNSCDTNPDISSLKSSKNTFDLGNDSSEGEEEENDTQSTMSDSIHMARENRQEVEEMKNCNANESMNLRRFSSSCPSLENQAMYEGISATAGPASTPTMQMRPTKGQYKSLLDVTQEENEEEVNAAISESPLISRRPSGERPKSLDFSTLGAKLSIAGVTAGSSSSDINDGQSFVDRNRKVSFNMFGGAQKEKNKFHQGVTSAGKRSFSLGSLGSEDDEDEQRARVRERSADSDGHVKPIDIYGPPPLQKLPNVDFSKHMGQQSDGSTSSLQSTSQEQLNRTHSVSTTTTRHSTQMRSTLLMPQTHNTSNLNKSKSVSTPSINQLAEQNTNTNRHSALFHQPAGKPIHSTDSLRRNGPRRPLSLEQENASGSSTFDDEEKKSKKGGRRTSVFAKFGSVRKTTKAKDKTERDLKRVQHNFIPVTLPSSTCHYCSKSLNYKPSVQCSNCLMNYHDECKERVPSCPKQKTRERKVPIVQSLSSQPSRHDSGDGIMSPSIGDSYSPSMESLVDDGNADDEYEDDPELTVKGFASESWSETIDKKVLKNHKEKYIRRQDNIWELIATERQYCLNLKIMQKVFAAGMRNECTLPDTAINKIFPELDELITLHHAFLSSLQDRQEKKSDRSVDHIGDIITKHFGGPTGERMKRSYGIFCSRHKEGIDYYKHLYKVDRRFQSFVKKVSNLACTKRRGVQDLVTVVTMRMTKYKTLIENIIKNTKESKDKGDKESLHKGLELNKEILNHIDTSIHNRNQELRLVEIFNKMDARSTALYDKIKKFKKSDLVGKNRKLRHEGVLSWRNAREKEVETLVIVLSDVILFLQENDKKYSFFTQDGKPSVIPLTSLIVREKGSTKDNRGIYLIRQSKQNPEMYELVCKSSQERREWIDLLRKAVNDSPEEDEGVINETEEEHREVIVKLAKLREYVEMLDEKDKELEKFCRDRFSIIADIMQVYDYADVLQNIKSCYDDDGELRSASELIKLSLDEASMLASLYQTVPAATNLGRSWSSVGERQSPTYQQLPLPKRAETFNGFDQDQVKSPVAPNKTILGDLEGKSPSLLNLHHDSDYEGSVDHGSKGETSRNISANRRSSSNILQQFLATNSASARPEEMEGGNDSLLTMSNMLAITAIIPPTKEQAQCVTQLNEYLHGILLVVNRQDTLLENVKQQLADVTVRSRKIEQEQEKKSALRHNKQMEEIRNRHEQLTKEREVLETEKENLTIKSENERVEMEALRTDMANQQNDLKKEREELQRQKEALQKQIDFYQVRGYQTAEPAVNSPSLSPHLTPHGSNSDLHNSTSSGDTRTTEMEISHRRSHSAELVEFDNPQLFVDPRYSASLTEPLNLKEVRAQFGHSTSPDRQGRTGSAGNLTKADRSNSQGSLKKISNNNTVQQIPSKLVTSSSSNKNSGTATNRHSKSMLPLNLAESSKKISNKEQGAKTPGQNKKGDVIYF